MTQAQVVNNTSDMPITQARIVDDLLALGVQPGSIVLVHSSLRTLGWVCGGAQAVILALEQALGPDGTLVMPTHSTDLSDPAQWMRPPVPQPWWQLIRDTMPAYDPDLTTTRQMGIIPETFRKQPGALRSAHPSDSFAARGPHAAAITSGHGLDNGLGETSPLGRLYDLDGWVMLLGVGHGNNTSLHLAEYRATWAGKRPERRHAPIIRDGQRIWAGYDDIECNSDDFVALGAAFAADTGLQRSGHVGNAATLLMPQRPLVDYAVRWIEQNRA